MLKALAAIILVLLSVAGTARPVAASIANPGFETGSFSPEWTESVESGTGFAVVVSEAFECVSDGTKCTGPGNRYYAAEGENFVLLVPDAANVPTVVWQEVVLTDGQKIEGKAAFKAYDQIGWNDWAAVRIYDDAVFAETNLVGEPWSRDVQSVGSFASTGWEYWSWEATAEGTYYLWYGVANAADDLNPSQAAFDAVPVPPSVLLLGTGLIVLGLRKLRNSWI